MVWGVVTRQGRESVMDRYRFADVLSLEDMVQDLHNRQPRGWADWVQTRRRWSDEMFDWLVYRER